MFSLDLFVCCLVGLSAGLFSKLSVNFHDIFGRDKKRLDLGIDNLYFN